MLVDTFTYTGDGSDPQDLSGNITNCSGDFTSVDTWILVLPLGSDEEAMSSSNTTDLDKSHAMFFFQSQNSNLITDLGTGTFSVRGTLNTNTSKYMAMICQYDGTTRDVETGSYTGDGNDNRDITVAGFDSGSITPDAVITMQETRYRAGRTEEGQGDETCLFSDVAAGANDIQSVGSGKFVVGSGRTANDNGIDTHYVVFKEASDACAFITWTGDSIDNRGITGIGFEPDFVFIMHTHNQDIVGREQTGSEANSGQFSAKVAHTNAILSFDADGFTISDDTDVNTSGNEYYAWCFKNSSGTAVGGLLMPVAMHHYTKNIGAR